MIFVIAGRRDPTAGTPGGDEVARILTELVPRRAQDET